MAAILREIVLGVLVMTAFISIMLLLINAMSDTYGSDVDATQLELFNRTQELTNQMEDMKDSMVIGSEVSSLESVASFLGVGLTAAKIVPTAILSIIAGEDGMLQAGANIIGVHPIIVGLIFAILITVVGFALIQMATGRIIRQ